MKTVSPPFHFVHLAELANIHLLSGNSAQLTPVLVNLINRSVCIVCAVTVTYRTCSWSGGKWQHKFCTVLGRSEANSRSPRLCIVQCISCLLVAVICLSLCYLTDSRNLRWWSGGTIPHKTLEQDPLLLTLPLPYFSLSIAPLLSFPPSGFFRGRNPLIPSLPI